MVAVPPGRPPKSRPHLEDHLRQAVRPVRIVSTTGSRDEDMGITAKREARLATRKKTEDLNFNRIVNRQFDKAKGGGP